MRRIGISTLVIAVAFTGLTLMTRPALADTATAVIQRFNQTLLETMQGAQKLGYDGRYTKLAPAIKKSFNLRFMTQYSAGRYWRDLTPAQRDELVNAFTQLTVATYANRFDGFSGEKFHVLGEETPRKNTKLVRTELETTSGKPVKLDYLLRMSKNGWRIIDIFLKGHISELSTKRSEYVSALRNNGFDNLMATFQQRIANLKSKSS